MSAAPRDPNERAGWLPRIRSDDAVYSNNIAMLEVSRALSLFHILQYSVYTPRLLHTNRAWRCTATPTPFGQTQMHPLCTAVMPQPCTALHSMQPVLCCTLDTSPTLHWHVMPRPLGSAPPAPSDRCYYTQHSATGCRRLLREIGRHSLCSQLTTAAALSRVYA